MEIWWQSGVVQWLKELMLGHRKSLLMRESDLWAVTAAAWEREKHRQGHPNDEGQGNWGNF